MRKNDIGLNISEELDKGPSIIAFAVIFIGATAFLVVFEFAFFVLLLKTQYAEINLDSKDKVYVQQYLAPIKTSEGYFVITINYCNQINSK